MKKALAFYDKLEERILAASLVFTVLLIFLQVVMRYVFNNSLSWSEELARFIFIWQIWYGISITVRRKKHIQVELILNLLKGGGRKVLQFFIVLISIGFCLFMTVTGWAIMQNLIVKNTLSPAMRIPLWTVYLSLPFSFFITGIRHVLELVPGFDAAGSDSLENGGNA